MIKILSTTDYNKFESMKGNRPVGKRINGLVRQVKRRNMLAQFPILCVRNGSGKLRIADGQHRFAAAKALGLPVFYTEAENITINDIALANSEQKAWNMNDYVWSWIQRGNRQYLILQQYKEEYLLPISTAALILGDKEPSADNMSIFREGRFVAVNLPFAAKVGKLIRAVRPFLNFGFDRCLGLALVYLMKLGESCFDPERFLHKLETSSIKLHKCANWPQYVDLIESIYNFHVQSKQLVPLALETKKVARPSGLRRTK